MRQTAAQHHHIPRQKALQQLLPQAPGRGGLPQQTGGVQLGGQSIPPGGDFEIDPGGVRGGIDGTGQLLLPQQSGQLLAGRPARDGQGNAVLGKDTQGPCHIDALAAGIAAAGKNPVGGAGPQMLHFQCFINSGIEGDGVDHKNHLRGKFPSPV